ncbi:hypothetical protein BH11VER1_BH11VER1_09050 [soil metagenome]
MKQNRFFVYFGGFFSSDGEIEFTEEEQDTDAKLSKGAQAPCIGDNPSN